MEKSLIGVIGGAACGLGSYFYGLPWELIIIYGILMSLDIFIGIIKSAKNKEWSSAVMREGLKKKAVELIILLAILLIQRVAMLNGITAPIGSIVVGIFCFKEFGSIAENYIAMGYKLPQTIQNWFKIAQDQIEGKGGSNEQNKQ